MPKYRIYAVYTVSKFLGEIEATSPEAAEEEVWQMDYYVGICHQCAGEIDVNSDPHTMQVEEADA